MRKSHRPVLVLLLGILQMIIAGSMLCCGAFNLVVAVKGDTSATITVRNGAQTTTRVYDTREEMEKEAPGYKSLMLASAIGGFSLAAVMILGAIGLLRARAWGWWLSLLWGLMELAYEVGTAVYLWMVAMPACRRVAQAAPWDEGNLCNGMVNGNTLYHFVWALFATVVWLYPIVILLVLILPPVRRAFRPIPRTDEEKEWDEAEENDRRRRRTRDE